MTTLIEYIDQLGRCDAEIVLGAKSGVRRFRWSELHRDVCRAAGALAGQGLRVGDHVPMEIHCEYERLVDFLAVSYIGGIPVSVKPMAAGDAHDRYLETVCEQVGARAVHASAGEVSGLRIVDGARAAAGNTERIEAAVVSAESIAFVQYTSGSTSAPKPVRVTHRSLAANIRGFTRFEGRGPDSVVLNVIPLNHDMGLVGGFLSPLYSRTPLVLVDTETFMLDTMDWLRTAHAAGVTACAMPNFMARYITYRLARERPAEPLLAGYRAIFLGAEPIGLQTTRNLLMVGESLGLDPAALIFAYGMAEATLMVSGHRFVDAEKSFDVRDGSPIACCGRAIEGIEWKIGTAEDADGVGPVLLRGDSMCVGARGEDYRVDWFDTGDVGYVSDENLYICGRTGDMVPLHGRNLFAADVEEFVRSNWIVNDVVMVPERDHYFLFIAPHGDGSIDVAEISRRLTDSFGAPPRAIEVGHRREIPRTSSGKPRREEFKARFTRIPA